MKAQKWNRFTGLQFFNLNPWWRVWSTAQPRRFTPDKDTRYPFYKRLDGPLWPVWTGEKILTHTGIRSPDQTLRSESLYRLSYPASWMQMRYIVNKLCSNFLRISPEPDFQVPKYCASTGVSADSLMQISYMILLYNRCTSYHRM